MCHFTTLTLFDRGGQNKHSYKSAGTCPDKYSDEGWSTDSTFLLNYMRKSTDAEL